MLRPAEISFSNSAHVLNFFCKRIVFIVVAVVDGGGDVDGVGIGIGVLAGIIQGLGLDTTIGTQNKLPSREGPEKRINVRDVRKKEG